MKPERIFSYTIFLIISFQSLQCQRSLFNDYVDLTASEICLTGELYTPDFIIDGTTYFNSEWLPGDIYLSNGEVVRNKLIIFFFEDRPYEFRIILVHLTTICF